MPRTAFNSQRAIIARATRHVIYFRSRPPLSFLLLIMTYPQNLRWFRLRFGLAGFVLLLNSVTTHVGAGIANKICLMPQSAANKKTQEAANAGVVADLRHAAELL